MPGLPAGDWDKPPPRTACIDVQAEKVLEVYRLTLLAGAGV